MNSSYVDKENRSDNGVTNISTSTAVSVDSILDMIKNRGINHPNVKSLLRDHERSIYHPHRAQLWITLCNVNTDPNKHDPSEDTFKEYADRLDHDQTTILPIKDLPEELRAHHLLNEQGINACHRVIYVISESHPHIQQFSSMFYSLTSLLLNYMSESKCYSCLVELLKRRDVQYFLTPSELTLNASTFVLKDLALKYARSSVSAIENSSSSDITECLSDWMSWIFKHMPLSYLVWIIDCYLVEGYKVLFRVALILIKLYHREFCSSTGKTSTWHEKSEIGIKNMCKDLFKYIPANRLMQQAFGIRAFSKKEVDVLFQKYEIELRNNPPRAPLQPLNNGLESKKLGFNKSSFKNTRPISPAVSKIQPQSIRQFSNKRPNIRDYGKQKSFKLDNEPHTHLLIEDVDSQILDKSQQLKVWSWLPAAETVKTPVLVFTTNEHGYTLKTFYEKVENQGPVLIIINTINHQILGAYCSSDWIKRHSTYDTGAFLTFFGNGQSFVFSCTPEVCYRWVGVTRGGTVPSNCSMFQAGDKQVLMIGGGEGTAIQLDADLDYGVTESCLTFDNPPLVSVTNSENSRKSEFRIQSMEAFAFV